MQHLHIGLPLQHLIRADVFGGYGAHGQHGLLVALGHDGKVGLGVGACAHILQRELAAIDGGIADDGVELGRRACEIDDEVGVVGFSPLIYIKVCGICKRYAQVGELDTLGLARRSQCEGGFHAVGSVALGSAVVIDGGLLA